MIRALTILLACQLAGEVTAAGSGLPLPGPVLGMTYLIILLLLSPMLMVWLRETATGLLGHLSLLFVPASVGLIQHAGRLQAEWLPILAAIFISTVVAIAVAAFVFAVTARWVGLSPEGEDYKP